jgi:molecular chaperone DnaK
MAKDNKTLGRFRLDGIPPATRGIPQIDVTFDIDANGILNVAARDQATGQEQRIEITASTNLTESDVEHMVREATQHEAEDRRLRDLSEARNQADQLVYSTEKALRELGDRVPPADRAQVESLVADVKSALEGEDTARIRSLSDQLSQASHAMSQQLYQAQQQAAPGGAQQSDTDDGVVEGEFTEV